MKNLSHCEISPFHKWAIYFYTHQGNGKKRVNQLTDIIKRIQEWDSISFKIWLANTNPNSLYFFNAIRFGRGFKTITRIDEIAIGHVIAINYHNGNGHVMLVRNFPKATATDPLANGLVQYEVEVYHSSQSFSLMNDTPKTGLEWDKEADFFWLYADASSHHIIGYARQNGKQRHYYPQSEHALIVGALL